MPRSIFLLLLSVALLSGLGCRPNETPADRAVREGVLILANGAEPKGLDHHTVTGVPEAKIINALMEGLIAEHPSDDATIEPGVAESWEISPDLRVFTFRIRENARWSNGDPVTADDFVFAYRRLLAPAFGAEYAEMLYIMAGAEAYHRGELADFEQVGVKALDARTLQITLVGPTPYFLQTLRHYTWFPIHRSTIETFNAFANRATAWTRPGNYVGNGPFTLKSWRVNQSIVVEKNPTYWDADVVRLQAIHFLPIDNRDTEERAFKAGQLHVTDSVPFNKRETYLRSRDPAFRQDPSLSTAYLLFNVNRGPLGDARVRRALSMAIDRAPLVENLTRSGYPASAFTPERMPGYQPGGRIEYDPETARRLLAEAGYPGGQGFPRIDLTITTSDTTRMLSEAIQDMWRRELGIQVQIVNMEWKVYISQLSERDYSIGFLSWYGDFVDPFTFLSVMTTEGGNNRTGWTNPNYDRLLQASMMEADPEQRMALLAEAERILLEESPIAPLIWNTLNTLVDPRLRGWHPKLLDMRPYKAVSFAE
jgi:oligopeptide transport system substrate-binding protein